MCRFPTRVVKRIKSYYGKITEEDMSKGTTQIYCSYEYCCCQNKCYNG